MKMFGDFQKDSYAERNLRFGVREHAMGAICNGLALHDTGLIPYCATFFIFTDYMRSAMRMSALSQAGVIYVMTHDSIGLGEDGPTHQVREFFFELFFFLTCFFLTFFDPDIKLFLTQKNVFLFSSNPNTPTPTTNSLSSTSRPSARCPRC